MTTAGYSEPWLLWIVAAYMHPTAAARQSPWNQTLTCSVCRLLPRHEQPSRQGTVLRDNHNSEPPKAMTVLVLDGDVLVRMPVCQYLRDCGYRVLEAASADEAAVILEDTDIHIDAVLADMEVLGRIDGFAFAQWARAVRPGVDIVLAATAERVTHAAGELCEHGPILKKPYDPKIVLDRIKTLLAARARREGS
jgi:CheY-like chemotaxis protein